MANYGATCRTSLSVIAISRNLADIDLTADHDIVIGEVIGEHRPEIIDAATAPIIEVDHKRAIALDHFVSKNVIFPIVDVRR